MLREKKIPDKPRFGYVTQTAYKFLLECGYNRFPISPYDVLDEEKMRMKQPSDWQQSLTLGSLFDGGGGFPFGGLINGITPLWASEVEPFCIRVTTKRLPQMKHYGDVSTLHGAKLPPVDIITFGSPCQDMSIAGKRSGLDGKRSSLFYQAVRIIKEMRGKTNGKYPRFAVWENVPGAFSSNKGNDFKAVLESLCQVKTDLAVPKPPDGKWDNAGCIMGENFSLAWRLFDAQYWGTAQRRKRIYLVADFDGGSAGKILFESESVSGDSSQSFYAWQGTARSAKESTGATIFCLNDQGGERMEITQDVTATLRAQTHGHLPLVFENHGKDARYDEPLACAPTITAHYGTGGNNQPLIVYGICANGSNSMKSSNPNSGFYEAQTSRCLDANGGNPACNQGGMCICEPVVCVEQGGGAPDVAFSQETYDRYIESDTGASLRASGGNYSGGSETLILSKEPEYLVRRLTPTECARLQGFPDWWCEDLGTEHPTEEEITFWRNVFETHRKMTGKSSKSKTRKQIIKWLKDPHSDRAEYKMWGNGVALPNVVFVLEGIVKAAYLEKEKKD